MTIIKTGQLWLDHKKELEQMDRNIRLALSISWFFLRVLKTTRTIKI